MSHPNAKSKAVGANKPTISIATKKDGGGVKGISGPAQSKRGSGYIR